MTTSEANLELVATLARWLAAANDDAARERDRLSELARRLGEKEAVADRLKRRLEQVEGERDRARDLVADLATIDERGTEREERATGKVDSEQDEAETEPTDWEPGADVTDRLNQAPEDVVLRDGQDDYWRLDGHGLAALWSRRRGWLPFDTQVHHLAEFDPLTVATAEQLRAAGILAGSDQPQDEEEN